MAEMPLIFRVRQKFDRPLVENIEAEVQAQLASLQLDNTIQPGQTVAVTAGSRGIANIDHIIRAVVRFLQQLSAEPFIVPAMGSHGGGTAEGQSQILTAYGITEQFCGCPIRSSMETVKVCEAAEGFGVYFDRHAFNADHVLVVGRIKPHTNFIGDIESGLMKMMLIGLGKHDGARIYHRAIMDYSFGQIVRSVAREVLAKCGIVGGLAIVENAYDETARLEAVAPADFETREKELLALSKRWLPKLPFDYVDVLLIDRMGKNISGTGMDTNVVGRKRACHEAAHDEFPKVKQIVIRDLTDETHGNAAGIGLAEICRTRVLRKMDVQATRTNTLTAGRAVGCMTPVDFETDREILDTTLQIIGLTEPPEAKLLWIRDTLHLAEVECSTAYLPEARTRDDLEILSDPRPLPLAADGNLCDKHLLVD